MYANDRGYGLAKAYKEKYGKSRELFHEIYGLTAEAERILRRDPGNKAPARVFLQRRSTDGICREMEEGDGGRVRRIPLYDFFFIVSDQYEGRPTDLFFHYYNSLHRSAYRLTVTELPVGAETAYIMSDRYRNQYRLYILSEQEYPKFMKLREEETASEASPAALIPTGTSSIKMNMIADGNPWDPMTVVDSPGFSPGDLVDQVVLFAVLDGDELSLSAAEVRRDGVRDIVPGRNIRISGRNRSAVFTALRALTAELYEYGVGEYDRIILTSEESSWIEGLFREIFPSTDISRSKISFWKSELHI